MKAPGCPKKLSIATWTIEQTELLKHKRFDEVDLEHLVEEIEDMGKSEKRVLESYIENLLMHLLKWVFHPYYVGRRSLVVNNY